MTESQGNAREHSFARQLIAVHDYFRQALADLRVDAEKLEIELRTATVPVETFSPRTRELRQHCLYFCGGLTRHHTGEDTHVFPLIRKARPDLAAVLDKLEADHVVVAGYLEQIEQVADALLAADKDSISALRKDLDRLSAELLEHLSYEEESIASVLDQLG